MHKLTNNRMTWGTAALLVGALLAGVRLTQPASVEADFRRNVEQRDAVVALAKAGRLKASPDPLVEDKHWKDLPLPYRHLSRDGLVRVEQPPGNTTVAFTRTLDGGSYEAFYFVSDGSPPHGPGESWNDVREMAPHWYWVRTMW